MGGGPEQVLPAPSSRGVASEVVGCEADFGSCGCLVDDECLGQAVRGGAGEAKGGSEGGDGGVCADECAVSDGDGEHSVGCWEAAKVEATAAAAATAGG